MDDAQVMADCAFESFASKAEAEKQDLLEEVFQLLCFVQVLKGCVQISELKTDLARLQVQAQVPKLKDCLTIQKEHDGCSHVRCIQHEAQLQVNACVAAVIFLESCRSEDGSRASKA